MVVVFCFRHVRCLDVLGVGLVQDMLPLIDMCYNVFKPLNIFLVVWLLAVCALLVFFHGYHNIRYEHNIGQDGGKSTSKRRVA